MQFKNFRKEPFRLASTDGHVIYFEAEETRDVPEALAQKCIEAGLTPVEDKKRGTKAE